MFDHNQLKSKLDVLNSELERINILNQQQKINYKYILFFNGKPIKEKGYSFFTKNINAIRVGLSDFNNLSIYPISYIQKDAEILVFINVTTNIPVFIDSFMKSILSDNFINIRITELIRGYEKIIKIVKRLYKGKILSINSKMLKRQTSWNGYTYAFNLEKLYNFDFFKTIGYDDCIILRLYALPYDHMCFIEEQFKMLEHTINIKGRSMKRIWSMATAVRNPDRLRGFLHTLKELENKVWNHDTQKEFQVRLVKNRLYGFGSKQFYSGLPQQFVDLLENISQKISLELANKILEAKEYPHGISIRGRTSYKPLEKMGLASIIDKKIKITSLGEYLLSDNYDLGEIFFRGCLKWQYPNPESRDFRNPDIYNIKPFIATMHLINEVNKICILQGFRAKGISRDEFVIFGQTLLHYKDISMQAKRIVDFRAELESIQDRNAKNKYVGEYAKSFLADFENAKHNNPYDYADNTIRYFRLTRYITVRGGGFYIDLEPRRIIEIQKLLETDNASAKEFTRDEYIAYMSDINQPTLPWEEQNELLNIYHSTLDDIKKLEAQVSIEAYPFFLENEGVEYLKSEIEKLREYRHKLQNIELKRQLQDVSQIDEVIDKLNNIRSQDLKPSIALEKYITHALNIINDAKDIKANSILSDDNDFIFTAPANKPDIECFYESFNSVCEVTMLTNRDQWHNEGQPVMRHFRDFESISNHQDNYCLFVAPSMHRDTINTFWMSVKYEYEGNPQKIIPLNISQIIQILQIIKELKLQNKLFSHLKFKQFLDEIVELKNSVTSSDEWLRTIPTVLNNFKQELLCS